MIDDLHKYINTDYDDETPFLEQIPREARDFFILNSAIKEVDKDDVLLKVNEEGESFYVLQTGQLKVCGEEINGTFTEIAILEKGSCFGEISMITEALTSNTIIATKDSTILCMDKENFIRFISDSPQTIVLLYKILAHRLKIKNKIYEKHVSAPLSGSFSTLAFSDIAQSFERDKVSGSFILNFEEKVGIISFKKGHMYYLKIDEIEGPGALIELMTWEDAFFRFDKEMMPDEENIKGNTTGLIMDAARDIDERNLKSKKPQSKKKLTES